MPRYPPLNPPPPRNPLPPRKLPLEKPPRAPEKPPRAPAEPPPRMPPPPPPCPPPPLCANKGIASKTQPRTTGKVRRNVVPLIYFRRQRTAHTSSAPPPHPWSP